MQKFKTKMKLAATSVYVPRYHYRNDLNITKHRRSQWEITRDEKKFSDRNTDKYTIRQSFSYCSRKPGSEQAIPVMSNCVSLAFAQ